MNVHAFKAGNLSAGQSNSTVSNQWLSRPADQRFLSLDDLRTSVWDRAQASVQQTFTSRSVEFFAPEPKVIEDTHKLRIGLPGGDEMEMSNWSFNQVCSLAKAPAAHYRSLPSQIVADALSYGMRYNREAELVKFYSSNAELLAATGPDYGRIFDHEVVSAVQQIAGNGTGDSRWKVPGVLDWRTNIYNPDVPITQDTTTLFASDRDVFIFLVDDRNPIEVGKLANGDPDLMFRGFYISNSEVGAGSLRLAAFYLRAVCANRILWGVEHFEELTMRHSKLAPARFIEQARPALRSFADGSSAKLIEGVEKAKAVRLANDQDEALEFLAERGFSRKRSIDIYETVEREEGRPAKTAWDFAQGITAVARNEKNNDARVEMEMQARRILDRVAA